ncbi:MAG: M20 family metallopeptidase [Isosphaeraceae bacterium]
MFPSNLLSDLRIRQDAMLASLKALVERESPSKDKQALDSLAAYMRNQLQAVADDVDLINNPNGGNHVLARFRPQEEDAAAMPPALVIGHFDTVWPLGTLADRPFRVEGERAYGPGIFDMKASLVLIEFALAAPRLLGLPQTRPIHVLLTSDEEIGSPTSRRLIEQHAKGCAYVLVLEPPLPGGRLKTARKGVGGFTVEIEGRAAHAGIEPEKGISAVLELAHQIIKVHQLADPKSGTTVSVGVIQGGSTTNVIPAQATARLDVRVTSMDEAKRIETALRALQPVTTGAKLTVNGGFNRPPMERTPAVAGLFDRAKGIGRTLGLDLTEGSTGGASDGNFTAALGLPTLDGLGVPGAGAHAVDEHILVASLPERAALLAALLSGL